MERGLAALAPMRLFFFALAAALALAWADPASGATGGVLRSELWTGWAVGLIFFIQGLQLPVREMRRGLGAWRAHVFCQGWMFLVYPLMGLGVVALLGGRLSGVERVGVLYLCVLPTTIATNAAFSAQAGGNAAVAVANIVLGNLLGVVLAPAVLAGLLAQGTGVEAESGPLVRTVLGQLVLPFAGGQVARIWWAGWAERHKARLRDGAMMLIMVIIHVAACNYLVVPERPVPGMGLVGAVLALLVGGKGLCWLALQRTGWPHEWRVAVFYAASQKTLAAGLPMAGAVLAVMDPAQAPPLAVLALPLVIFHVGQLLLGALLVPVVARRD